MIREMDRENRCAIRDGSEKGILIDEGIDKAYKDILEALRKKYGVE